MNAIQIINLPISNDTRKALRACTDLAVLEEALRMEEAKPGQVGDKGGPRASMVGMLKLRVDVLRADQPAPVVVVQTATVVASNDPGMPVGAQGIMETKLVQDNDGQPAISQGFTASPAPVVDPVAEAPVANPASNCATTFVMALREGDARMLSMLVGVVRDRSYTAEQVAEALVGAYKAQAPASTRAARSTTVRQPAQPGVGRVDPVTETNVARVRAAILLVPADEHGEVVLTQAQMAQVFPASWATHGTLWSRKGRINVAAESIGWTARYRNLATGPVAVFTRVPAAE